MSVAQVDIDLLGRRFTLACPDEERAGLMAAARMLEERMRAIRDSGRVVDAERIAILAALNITHELMQGKTTNPLDSERIQRKIKAINETVETALTGQADLF